MNTLTKFVVWGTAFLATVPARAHLKDIHPDKLPQSPAVQKAYSDAVRVEDMVRQWSVKWPYETPKGQVTSLLKNSLAELQKASTATPNNTELLLLTGLVARYAYNLDIDGAEAVVMKSFNQAHGLSPEDPRPEWFLSGFKCQTAALVHDGMENLLAIEKAYSWEKLPGSFWDDYLECAVHANMPAHGLRAADHAFALKAEPSAYRDTYVGMLKKRFTHPDTSATYPAKEVWYSDTVAGQVTFTNTMFGFAITVPGTWGTSFSDVQGALTVRFETGPYTGNRDKVTPNILVLARPPKSGETLEDFLGAIMKNQSSQTAKATTCPVQECLAFEAVKPGAYGEDGDGHGFFIAFRRDAPEYSGLLFERPAVPHSTTPGKIQYFRPAQTMHRLDGAIYYLVLLDTARSVRDKAMRDYESFLKGMQVE